MRLFVIAGHGHGDSGAIGYGYTEAERVRKLAKKIKELGGDEVGLGDINKDFYGDAEINNIPNYVPHDAQVLELHMDSSPSASAKGGHVIITSAYDPDDYDMALAKMISTMFPGRYEILKPRNDLYNLNCCANMGYSYRLMECGFISNENDLRIFNDNIETLANKILSIFGIVSSGSSSSSGGEWVKDETGWWYKYSDGSYPKSQWLQLDSWYYFNDDGYAVTGWNKISDKWYFFDSSCRLLTNQYIQSSSNDNFYHWVDSNGEWIESSDSWNVDKYVHYESN